MGFLFSEPNFCHSIFAQRSKNENAYLCRVFKINSSKASTAGGFISEAPRLLLFVSPSELHRSSLHHFPAPGSFPPNSGAMGNNYIFKRPFFVPKKTNLAFVGRHKKWTKFCIIESHLDCGCGFLVSMYFLRVPLKKETSGMNDQAKLSFFPHGLKLFQNSIIFLALCLPFFFLFPKTRNKNILLLKFLYTIKNWAWTKKTFKG